MATVTLCALVSRNSILRREYRIRKFPLAVPQRSGYLKAIAERIENRDALIAIIGKDWLHAEDGEGKRRLDDPDDWVKAEIREALTSR